MAESDLYSVLVNDLKMALRNSYSVVVNEIPHIVFRAEDVYALASLIYDDDQMEGKHWKQSYDEIMEKNRHFAKINQDWKEWVDELTLVRKI